MVSATDQTKANTHLSVWPSALVCDSNHAFPVLGFALEDLGIYDLWQAVCRDPESLFLAHCSTRLGIKLQRRSNSCVILSQEKPQKPVSLNKCNDSARDPAIHRYGTRSRARTSKRPINVNPAKP